jgi:hypothetical protein
MSEAERVAKFVQEGAGDFYCDDCIQRPLGFPTVLRVRQITSSFAFGGGFERTNGSCSICHRYKRVIRALAGNRKNGMGSRPV